MARLSTLAFVMAALVVGAAIADATATAADLDYLHPVKDKAKIKAAIKKALQNRDPLPRHAGMPFRLAHVKTSSGRRLLDTNACDNNSCSCPPDLPGLGVTCACQQICSEPDINVWGFAPPPPYCVCFPLFG